MTVETVKDYPQPRQMTPDFALPSSTGREYQVSKLRGRRDLVLVFIGTGDAFVTELLRALATHAQELEEEEALVLVVFRGDMGAAEALRKRDAIPFPVLADRDGSVHERYGAPAVYVTDRYGEIYSACRETLPDADEILASLRHINAACPE